MKARILWLSFLSWLFAFAASLPAQDGTLTVKAAIEPATAKPGDKVVLVLTAKVSLGWHAYGTSEKTNIPVDLKAENLKLGGLEVDGPPQIPPGDRHTQPYESYPLPNEFTVKQPLKVPAGVAAGEVTVTGAFDYQICDANMCLPPDQATFTAKVTIEAAAGGAPAAKPQEPAPRTETKPGLKLESDAKVAITAKFEPATVRAGEHSTLVLTVTMLDKEWHAYGELEKTVENGQTPVSVSDTTDWGDLERVGDAVVPPGEKHEKNGKPTFPLPPVFEVKQTIRVPAKQKPGAIDVDGALIYQICNAVTCDMATEIGFQAKLAVEAGEARSERTQPPKATPAETKPAKGVDAGTLWALVLACFAGALFALAMPCTYPMIPITFSFFTKQAEKRGGNVMPLALTYGLGIVVMFVFVGVALSEVIIDVANHWVTNSVIGIVFLLFACSLLGWINLQPPRFLQDVATKAGGRGGYLGVFFMGAALVITSFTCTAPIVGSVLLRIVELGTLPVVLGMVVFGLTMATPFVMLSLLPGKVKQLPRSGEWMETLKVSLGFVELAATLKFVSMVDIALDWNALPRELFLLLIAAIFGLWAMFLFGMLRKAGSGVNEGVGAGRMATGMIVVLFATYMLFGAMGYKLDFYMTAFAPPYSAPLVGAKAVAAAGANTAGEHVAAGAHTIVKDDGDKAVEVAKAEGKLLLYNFTGFN